MINYISVENIPAQIKAGYTIKKNRLYELGQILSADDVMRAKKSRSREIKRRQNDAVAWMEQFSKDYEEGRIKL